ncbi:unnamed protein product [Absidia cylindrospora]
MLKVHTSTKTIHDGILKLCAQTSLCKMVVIEQTNGVLLWVVHLDYHPFELYDQDGQTKERQSTNILCLFSSITGLIDFTWCEKGLLNNRLASQSQWSFALSLLDGVGNFCQGQKWNDYLLNHQGHIEKDAFKKNSNTIKWISKNTNWLPTTRRRFALHVSSPTSYNH